MNCYSLYQELKLSRQKKREKLLMMETFSSSKNLSKEE